MDSQENDSASGEVSPEESEVERIVVVGAAPLAHTVAQLTVASGRRVTCATPDGPPVRRDPWVEGVDWIGAEDEEALEKSLHGAKAVVWIGGETSECGAYTAEELGERVRNSGVGRAVFVTPGDETSGERALDARFEDETTEGDDEFGVVRLRPGDLGRQVEVEAGAGETVRMEAERVGMAALRAAVEEGRHGEFGPEEVAELGDAVMMQ